MGDASAGHVTSPVKSQKISRLSVLAALALTASIGFAATKVHAEIPPAEKPVATPLTAKILSTQR